MIERHLYILYIIWKSDMKQPHVESMYHIHVGEGEREERESMQCIAAYFSVAPSFLHTLAET
jgi:hypothetical protein